MIAMACPYCGCKETYTYDDEDDGQSSENLERCSACRNIFDVEEHLPEEDDHD